MSNNKATNPNGNKDLSCLRCRKKKAKCSKTRPTCARCERSNHPCEYPDAPPNLTDLSKKVLDLYDSLRDLEGELLFKYMQPPVDQNGLNNKNPLDRGDPIALMEINSTSSPMHQHQQPSSPSITNQNHSTATTTNDPPAPAENQDIDWSMSYLSDGISIQTSTHTIAEFTRFIDKLTQQLFRDFGTDGAFSTYWDLDITQGSLMIDDNDTDEDDDLDEDAYLVTVPIFDTNLFLSAPPSAPPSTPPENNQLSSTLPTLLPKLLQYVHTQLKYIDDTNFDSSLHRHVSPLLHQLITFLPAQDDDSLQQDPLTTLCIMTAYLTCTTFFSRMDTDITDPIIGQNWTPQESYMYAKAILIDTALQVTPTHGTCVSALLLLLIQVHSAYDDCGYVLLDLTWRMVGSGLVWHQGTAMTPETETMAAALIYLDTYITIFTSQQHHSSHLGHDIGSALRQRMSLSISKTQQQQSMLLESQLMWFLSQVLGLFYTRNSIDTLETATVKVRKVDVDEVLTLVRDLEQWEQQLPSWAMCNTDASLPQSTNNSMMIQLHLTLHIIKILLFRPFCTAFNQQGTEQTYTKTTFLDLSMHSASRLATCVAQMKHEGGKAMKQDDDGWLLMAYRLIRDVVGRVRTTFDDDQDIKLQLDAIIHRIDS